MTNRDLIDVLNRVRTVADLPVPVLDLLDRAAHLDSAYAAVVEPEKVPDPAAAVAAGADPGTAHRDHDTYTAAKARAARDRRTIHEARMQVLHFLLPAALADHGDEIIAESIRSVVNDLLELARSRAAKLAAFAPDYDAERILDEGTPAQVKAWQELLNPRQHFASAVALWERVLAHQLPHQGGHGNYYTKSEHLRFDAIRNRLGGEACWLDPHLVADEKVRGKYFPTDRHGTVRASVLDLLTVAAQDPAAGFRLATVPELHAAYEAGMAAKAAREGWRYTGEGLRRLREVAS